MNSTAVIFFADLLTAACVCVCVIIVLGCNDATHRKLAESYAALNRHYEHLKLQYRDILLVHEGVCAETKLLKKALVALQSLVSILVILPDFLEQQFFAFSGLLKGYSVCE